MVYSEEQNAEFSIYNQLFTNTSGREDRNFDPSRTDPACKLAFSNVFPRFVKTNHRSKRLIIKRAFYKEAAQTSLAVALVLSVIFTILVLTKLLGRAAGGQHSSDVVFWLMGLELLSSLEILLPLAVYLGILLTLGRWYRDSEMTVLAASGVGLEKVSVPVMILAGSFSVMVAAVALVLAPWANTAAQQVKNESKSKTEVSTIEPGVFMELRDSRNVLYAERVGDGGVLENVFIHGGESPNRHVVVADTAWQLDNTHTGEKFLVLEKGSMYQGVAGEPDYEWVEFGAYRVRIKSKHLKKPAPPLDGVPSLDLLRSQDRYYAAEWHWRLAKPLSVLVLAVFAMVMAHTDPRRGRMANLLAAVLLYFIYVNALGIGESLLKEGAVPQVLGLWWVHGGLGLVAAYLFARRAANKSLLPLPRLTAR